MDAYPVPIKTFVPACGHVRTSRADSRNSAGWTKGICVCVCWRIDALRADNGGACNYRLHRGYIQDVTSMGGSKWAQNTGSSTESRTHSKSVRHLFTSLSASGNIFTRELQIFATSEVGCLLFAIYGMKREYREMSFIWEKCSLIATFPAAAQQGIFLISPRRALSGWPYGGSCKKDYSQWIGYCMSGVHSWLSVQRC